MKTFITGVLWESAKPKSPINVPRKFSYHLTREHAATFIAEHSSGDFIPLEGYFPCMPEDPEYIIIADSKNGVWEDELIKKLNES
ncbi:MAG TPA: hypothetical protein PK257_02575 [Candidatus Woesebacteria bacterium]|nr:hypothetical protein [Candidatus Woesebacteria bacterium]